MEMDSDRSTCFSAGDPEVGDLVDSDFEAERLSNLEEEDNDNEEANEEGDSQSSVDLEFGREEKEAAAFNGERQRRMNRFALSSMSF